MAISQHDQTAKELLLNNVESKSAKTGIDTLCGCGRHPVNVCDKNVALYQDQYWHLRCLCMRVDRRIPVLMEKYDSLVARVNVYRKAWAKFIQLKRFVKKLRCATCGYPVGNRFVVKKGEDEIMCGQCARSED